MPIDWDSAQNYEAEFEEILGDIEETQVDIYGGAKPATVGEILAYGTEGPGPGDIYGTDPGGLEIPNDVTAGDLGDDDALDLLGEEYDEDLAGLRDWIRRMRRKGRERRERSRQRRRGRRARAIERRARRMEERAERAERRGHTRVARAMRRDAAQGEWIAESIREETDPLSRGRRRAQERVQERRQRRRDRRERRQQRRRDRRERLQERVRRSRPRRRAAARTAVRGVVGGAVGGPIGMLIGFLAGRSRRRRRRRRRQELERTAGRRRPRQTGRGSSGLDLLHQRLTAEHIRPRLVNEIIETVARDGDRGLRRWAFAYLMQATYPRERAAKARFVQHVEEIYAQNEREVLANNRAARSRRPS